MKNTKEMKYRKKTFNIRKNDKGITMVSLIITIVIMLIISSITVNVSVERAKVNNLNKMFNDIELLSDKVANYYLEYEGLPIARDPSNNPYIYTYTELNFDKDENDNENYYILDLEALEEISLNYGKDGFENKNESDDVYIINEKSHRIYYVKGVELAGIRQHSLDLATTSFRNYMLPTKPQIKIVEGELIETDTESYYNGKVVLEFIPGVNNAVEITKTTYSINDGEEIDISELENNMITIQNDNSTEEQTYNITLKTYNEYGEYSSTTMSINVKVASTLSIEVGSIINYKPYIDTTKTVEVTPEESGVSDIVAGTATSLDKYIEYFGNGQIFTIDGGIKWKVLKNDGTNIYITTTKPATIATVDTSGETKRGKGWDPNKGETGEEYDNPGVFLYSGAGYINQKKILDRICALCLNEEVAVSARSITSEDINEVNGYTEPEPVMHTYTQGDGYVISETGGISTSENESDYNKAITTFKYYNVRDELTELQIGSSVNLIDNYYSYNLEDMPITKIISETFNTFSERAEYWVADRVIHAGTYHVTYDLKCVRNLEDRLPISFYWAIWNSRSSIGNNPWRSTSSKIEVRYKFSV